MTAPTPQDFTEAGRWRRRPRPTFAWTAQVVTGVLLLVLVTVHMVAQHFLVPAACAATPRWSPGSVTRWCSPSRPCCWWP